MFITVIIPVRNEARFIERTLKHLSNQDFDPDRFEILVVDGQSTDDTRSLVAKFAAAHPNVRLLDNPQRLSSAARNIAIRHAGRVNTGTLPICAEHPEGRPGKSVMSPYSQDDVVFLVDGHCELADRQHLQKLAAAFDRSGADCIGRPQPLDIAGASLLQRAIAAARSSRLGHHPDSFIYSSEEQFVPAKSVAVAYRRSVFERVGYFDEEFDACEDVELNHRIDRAGLKCFFAPEVAVHYAPRDTLRGLFRQLVRYGRGRVRLLRKHRETFSLLPVVPGLFVAGVLLGPFAGLCLAGTQYAGWLAVVYGAVLLLYAAIVLAGSIAVAGRVNDYRLVLWLPLVFATVHAGSGTGLLWEAVSRGTRVRGSRKDSLPNPGMERRLRKT